MSKRSSNLFDDLFGDALFGWKTKTVEKVEEKYDGHLRSYRSTSDDKSMTLTVDLPGIDPRSVSLHVGNDQVVVRGRNKGKDFTQRYTISNEFDVSTARASLRHGQLEIGIARSGELPPLKEVPIEIA